MNGFKTLLGYICPYCGYAHSYGSSGKSPNPPRCISCQRELKQIKCARCGKINDYADIDLYCPDCGHYYGCVSIKCPNGHKNSYKHLYCTTCGVLLNRDEEYWTSNE